MKTVALYTQRPIPWQNRERRKKSQRIGYVIYIKTRLIIQVSYAAQSFSLEMFVKSASNYVVVLNS